jgi:sec-independent protein translocase protein TatA
MIFGAKRIPEIMSGLGKGIKSFKKSMDEEEPAPTQAGTTAVPGNDISKEKIEPKA